MDNKLVNKPIRLINEVIYVNEITESIDEVLGRVGRWDKAYIMPHSDSIYGIMVPGASIGHILIDPSSSIILKARLYDHSFNVVANTDITPELGAKIEKFIGCILLRRNNVRFNQGTVRLSNRQCDC